jgi:hypothetical protein
MKRAFGASVVLVLGMVAVPAHAQPCSSPAGPSRLDISVAAARHEYSERQSVFVEWGRRVFVGTGLARTTDREVHASAREAGIRVGYRHQPTLLSVILCPVVMLDRTWGPDRYLRSNFSYDYLDGGAGVRATLPAGGAAGFTVAPTGALHLRRLIATVEFSPDEPPRHSADSYAEGEFGLVLSYGGRWSVGARALRRFGVDREREVDTLAPLGRTADETTLAIILSAAIGRR